VQPHRHECAGVDPVLADQLNVRISREPWLMHALRVVQVSGLPDAWIGAGVIRDVIWGQLNDRFDPTTVHDIDVAFFDPDDVSGRRDETAQQELHALADDLPWEATNQAAVHTWYHRYFGGQQVEAFTCVHDAVATWPETATSVAVRNTPDGIDICGPHGLTDLLTGVWRRNPTRVAISRSQERLTRQRPTERWPSVTVIAPTRTPSS
jgi:hypothetical protein